MQYAYPFKRDLGGLNNYDWAVWRPDRRNMHFGHYTTAENAQKSADKINLEIARKCPVPIAIREDIKACINCPLCGMGCGNVVDLVITGDSWVYKIAK